MGFHQWTFRERAYTTCKFYLESDDILGTRAATRPPRVWENSSGFLYDEVQENTEFASDDDEAEEHTDDTIVMEEQSSLGTASSVSTPRPEASLPSSFASSSFDCSMKRQKDFQQENELEESPPKQLKSNKTLSVADVVGDMDKFVRYQEKADEKFRKHEEDQRKEEREHEVMLRMLMSAFYLQQAAAQFGPPHPHQYSSIPQHNFLQDLENHRL